MSVKHFTTVQGRAHTKTLINVTYCCHRLALPSPLLPTLFFAAPHPPLPAAGSDLVKLELPTKGTGQCTGQGLALT